MNAAEFLGLLLPSTGWLFTATLGSGGGWNNTPHQSIHSAVDHINHLTFANHPAYFALASYAAERVWDPDWKDATGTVVGKFRQRTQANTQSIKSFYLDLDVDASDPKKFASKTDALQGLIAFAKKLGLPKPMVVDSGGGIHAYWPLVHEVAIAQWRPVADTFKAICVAEKFRADRSLTSDQARVLRCLGGFNFKRGMPVKLLARGGGPYAFADIAGILTRYADDMSVQTPPSKAPVPAAAAIFEDQGNLGSCSEPINFSRAAFHCVQLGAQVGCRGRDVGEQLWRAGLGLAKFAEDPLEAARSVSDGYAKFSEAYMRSKMDNWRTGPTACEHFHSLDPAPCEACPHWKNITSPAQLGRVLRTSPGATIVTLDEDTGIAVELSIPAPPEGYVRSQKEGVLYGSENPEGLVEYETVCPYDLYPIKILRQNGTDHQVDERSVWRAHLPRIGAIDMDITQSLISDSRRLYAHLLSKGIYMTPANAAIIQRYMSAYLQILAEQADRERLYEHLGWNNERKSFVLGDKVMHRDGTHHTHIANRVIQAVTKDGVIARGTLDGWKEAMRFYNRPGYEGHRFFIYASLGAPLFHMNDTGNKGVLMTASGESGRGKTTCLRACASIWGVPENLILNGNKDGSTINALYETLGTYHSLPFMWDDITERDPEEIRRFLLNISQGKGKERMRGVEHSGRAVSWETIVLASANTDDVSRIMASGKDVDPHLMRLVGVEFRAIDTNVESKIQADRFLRSINANYGHAGQIFIRFVTQHYDKVSRGYIKNVAMVDRKLNSSNASAERYWSATVAAAYTGAQIACSLGLLDFPYEADLEWMIKHLTGQRTVIAEGKQSPREVLNEFLEHHIGNTLVVSAKAASNLDNVVLRPFNSLIVRHEIDTGLIYIARSSMMEYCTEVKISFRKVEQALEDEGLLLARTAQKVLGADTQYAKGQTRAWKIDATKLSTSHLPSTLAAQVTL